MIRFKDENKMKKYLSWRLERKVTEEEFKDECKDYLEETLEYIKDERDNKCLIRERACLELEIDNDYYEIWVTYDSIIENGEEVYLIDFDYGYDDFASKTINLLKD